MELTLLQDAPKRSRRVALTWVLVVCLLLGGGGLGYVLHDVISPRGSSRPVIVLLGDSLTEYGSNVSTRGWVSQLQAEYVRTADVINRGVAGSSTRSFLRGVLPRVGKELSRWLQPSLITVWLGANDAADPAGRRGYLHVPLDDYRNNLATILGELQSRAPKATILLLTPPPVDAEMRRAAQAEAGVPQDTPDQNNPSTSSYVDACKTVGSAFRGVHTLDVFGYFMATFPNATERAKLLVDGLHLARAGNDVVFQLVDQQIQKLMPRLAK